MPIKWHFVAVSQSLKAAYFAKMSIFGTKFVKSNSISPLFQRSYFNLHLIMELGFLFFLWKKHVALTLPLTSSKTLINVAESMENWDPSDIRKQKLPLTSELNFYEIKKRKWHHTVINIGTFMDKD